MAQQVAVWCAAGFFLFAGVVVLVKSKWNAGSALIWLLAAVFTLWGLFPAQVAAFTARGPGLWLMLLFWLALVLLAVLMVFLALAGRGGSAKGDEAAIIVLGAGLHRTRVSDILERRLWAALQASEQNPAALVVVSGGQGRGEDIPEAAAMQSWLVAQGLPEGRILAEDKSTSTRTNLQFCRALLEARGLPPQAPVAVVTNTFHCYRARCYARQAGFGEVRSIPASMNRPTFLQNYLREALAVLALWVFYRPRGEGRAE